MKSFTILVVLVALTAFGCGSSPTNNANANRSNMNTMMSNSNMMNSTNMMSNSATTSTNTMSNSAANSRTNTSATSNTSKSNTTASNTTVAGDKKIKGNKATKVYHLPGCPDYDKISTANVVLFATEQEARAAGYKLAGNCK